MGFITENSYTNHMPELYFNGEIYYHNMGDFDFTEKSIINLLTIKMEARYVHQINVESSFTESEKKMDKMAQKRNL